jgi:hypothetical protein
MIGTLLSAIIIAPSLALSVRVDGEGYLRFVRDGRIVYASSTTLTVQSGVLGAKGFPLTPAIRIPANAVRLNVDLAGNILVVVGTSKATCGRLVLSAFAGKLADDKGFLTSAQRATLGNPGEGTFGVIRTTPLLANSAAPEHPLATSASATVSVNLLSEVQGDKVTLGEIANVSGDVHAQHSLSQISLGSTPPVGIDMPITETRVLALIKRAGLKAEVQVPHGAVIRRKVQLIQQADFVTTATSAAQEKLGVTIPMTCTDSSTEFKAPPGQVELKAETTTSSGTHFSVVVAVFVDGKRVNSRTINLQADTSAQIKPNTTIKILMKSSGVTVEVGGKARTGGMVGQTVTVVTDTGSVLTGVVTSAGTVEVKI